MSIRKVCVQVLRWDLFDAGEKMRGVSGRKSAGDRLAWKVSGLLLDVV